jgi:tetratricopeptide (TPR) repeat protein
LRIPARASIFIALTAAALGAEPWDEAIARANLLTGQAKYTEAEGALKEALEEAGGAEAKDPRAAAVLNNLGALYRDMGRYPAAERFYLRAIDLLEAIQPNYAAELTKTHGNLAALYVESRQFRKAERFCRRVMAAAKARDPGAAALLHTLAASYHAQRRYADAEALYQDVLETLVDALGEDHPDVARVRHSIAILWSQTGREADALSRLRKDVTLWTKIFGGIHPEVANAWFDLGVLSTRLGNLAEADAAFRQGMSILERSAGAAHPQFIMALCADAEVLRRMKRKNEARESQRRAKLLNPGQAARDCSGQLIDIADLASKHRPRDR